jgi:transposase
VGRKVSAARKRSGQAERVQHLPGRKRRVGVAAGRQVLNWVQDRPDLTLAELQAKLHGEAQSRLCLSAIWRLVRRLGLRLKKSYSKPPGATPKPTASNARSSLKEPSQLRPSA